MLFDIEKPSVPVMDGGDFPVRRIYCVGQNYRAHAVEMGSNPDREAPFFFQKPATAIVQNGAEVPYPPATNNLHHEVELVVAIGAEARAIDAANASQVIFGYAVGLDMTRRDLQTEAKKAGRPWDMSKGFDASAPCAPLVRAADARALSSGEIRLTVNGDVRQAGDLSDMIWNVDEIISGLSHLVALAPGDLIFTGTPEGVGPVVPGDRLLAHIENLVDLTVTIVDPVA